MARFSAGLIPFRCDALTAGVDPIKYYEYRAAGLPVLSTSFGEMALRGRDDGVYFLDRTDNLAGTVAAALGHRCDPAEANRFRRQNSWTSRFHESDGFRSLWPALTDALPGLRFRNGLLMDSLVLTSAAAFVASLFLTAVVRAVARRRGIVDRPDGKRKLHGRPVPLLGGVAVYGATALGLLAVHFTAGATRSSPSFPPPG